MGRSSEPADRQLAPRRHSQTHIETIHVEGSSSTHNRALRTLRRCLNVAHELDVLSKMPKFSLVKEEGRSELITADIESRMAAEMSKSKRKGILQVGLYIILDCGLRPKKIANLAIPDVDLKAGTIRVTRRNTKTRKGVRVVPMTQRVRGLLATQIGPRTEGWVFPSPRYPGQPIKRAALTQAWRRTATKAGVSSDVDLYFARHTFGTDLFKATKDPFLPRDLMGHTDLSTTERYQHPELHHVGGLMDACNQTRLEAMS